MNKIFYIGCCIIIIIIFFYVLNNYLNNFLNNIEKFDTKNRNIVVYTPGPYTEQSGGINILYYFSKILDENGKNIRIYCPDSIKNNHQNPYLNKYYNDDFDITEAIVIYPEVISGNPLNSKYVVRWIMASLGINCPENIYQSWGDNDLIYYFNYEQRFENSNYYGKYFKLLPVIIINPIFKNMNLKRNNKECHTYRKSNYHKNKIIPIHKDNSFELNTGVHEELLKIFNEYSYFYSYDPLTFLSIIASLCGCISVVYPIDGKTKQEWIKGTAAYPYIKETNEEIYGVAYGINDIDNAKNTIDKVEKQWNDIIEFNKNHFYNNFLNDLNNIEDGTLPNTLKNILSINNKI
jgi:hypothetical protein